MQRNKDLQKLNTATKLNAEVDAWKRSLPLVLSGQIHSSSLIRIFQRQIVVMQLAHSLVVMLINRPLLLVDSDLDTTTHILACLTAAKTTLDVVLGFVSDKKTFPAFWYTQYVTFNALSVVYVWLVQRKRGRFTSIALSENDDVLYALAETIQRYLGEATQANAPSLRYSIILEELQREAQRLMVGQLQPRPPSLDGLLQAPSGAHPYASPLGAAELSPSSSRTGVASWDSMSGDFPLDPNLWCELDYFPFCKSATATLFEYEADSCSGYGLQSARYHGLNDECCRIEMQKLIRALTLSLYGYYSLCNIVAI